MSMPSSNLRELYERGDEGREGEGEAALCCAPSRLLLILLIAIGCLLSTCEFTMDGIPLVSIYAGGGGGGGE